MSLLALLNSQKTFPHGIHPPECKEGTEEKGVRRFPFPGELTIPLSQHLGAPAKPIVRAGQEVVRGEPIAEPGGFVSVPMHAPATGVITKIAPVRNLRGDMAPAIIMRPYPADSQEVLYGGSVDPDSLSPEELVQAVQSTGMVGLGGAAFPTHVKLAVPEGKSIDTVVVNGCECEPYLTTDHRVMLENMDALFTGLRIVTRAVGAERAIIGIENNKPDAIEALRAALPEGEPFSVEAVQTKYPQGAEKMLIKALVNREVPSGGLPMDVGAAVFNVATLAQIGELLPRKEGLIERVITVTGPLVENPGNYLIPMGTSLRFILDYCGFAGEDASRVILGGPMMGFAVSSLDLPVTKGVSGILVLPKLERVLKNDRVFPCIKCGNCVQGCPMHLNPSLLGTLARNREYELMAENHNLMDCFECGSCAYVCPSCIPLVQQFRTAKAIIRERKAAK